MTPPPPGGGVRRWRRKWGGFVLRDRLSYYSNTEGWDSSVFIATRYRLDGPVIESLWGGGEIFLTCPDRPWGLLSLLDNRYGVFPGDKAAGTLTTHPHLAPRLKKE